jgi:hypothetical protein
MEFGEVKIGVRVLWYPALNLDRALALSWVGRFCCLTQELVTRLNFSSASAQAAPPLLPLLTLLLTFCPSAAQGTQSRITHTQSRFWALAIISEPCLAHAIPSNFLSILREGLLAQIWDLWGRWRIESYIWTRVLYLSL